MISEQQGWNSRAITCPDACLPARAFAIPKGLCPNENERTVRRKAHSKGRGQSMVYGNHAITTTMVMKLCTSLLSVSTILESGFDTICCEYERSFCQNVTCMWLPLQLCCGDHAYLPSFPTRYRLFVCLIQLGYSR